MISIRWKFLAILVGLVVVTLLAFLGLAVRLYEADKQAYIFDSNASVVTAIASETESMLASTGRTFSALGDLALEDATRQREQLASLLFERQADLVDVAVFLVDDAGNIESQLLERTRPEYWELHDLEPRSRLTFRQMLRLDIGSLPPGKVVVRNTLAPGGVPIMLVGLRQPGSLRPSLWA